MTTEQRVILAMRIACASANKTRTYPLSMSAQAEVHDRFYAVVYCLSAPESFLEANLAQLQAYAVDEEVA